MGKKYTETELNDLVSQLEQQFNTHLEKSEKTEQEVALKKAEDEKKDDKKEDKADDKKDAKSDKKDDKDEKKDDKKEDKKDEMPAFMKSEYPAEAIGELGKLYSGMTKSERAAHFEALKKAEETPAPAPVKEEVLTKSQADEIAALKKSNEELQRGMASLIETMNKKVVKPAPKGKGVTTLAALEKSESEKPQLSREEIKKVLNRKAMTPDLSKSDRGLINDWCQNKVGIDSIQHLLGQN